MEPTKVEGWQTAISRKMPSAPLAWLLKEGHVVGTVLDFGCGRGFDADYLLCDGWDPYWRPENKPTRLYDTVLATYVLNVIPEEDERDRVLHEIEDYLYTHTGVAYITVRRDLPREGLCYAGQEKPAQVWVEVEGAELIRETSSYAIYKLRRVR
jgi:hypothetical protein